MIIFFFKNARWLSSRAKKKKKETARLILEYQQEKRKDYPPRKTICLLPDILKKTKANHMCTYVQNDIKINGTCMYGCVNMIIISDERRSTLHPLKMFTCDCSISPDVEMTPPLKRHSPVDMPWQMIGVILFFCYL